MCSPSSSTPSPSTTMLGRRARPRPPSSSTRTSSTPLQPRARSRPRTPRAVSIRPVSPEERLDAYARLVIEVGLALEEGQTLEIQTFPENAEFARAVTRAAYAAGARYVDVMYEDEHVRKAMIELGPEEV